MDPENQDMNVAATKDRMRSMIQLALKTTDTYLDPKTLWMTTTQTIR